MEAHSKGPGTATLLLHRMAEGDRGASEELLALLYTELHGIAERAMAGRRAQTLQPTALLNEACLKLLGAQNQHWSSRAHFLSVAAKAMRSIMVDCARRRAALKRGGEMQKLPMEALMALYERETPNLVELDDALTRLFAIDEQLGKIVELRFFAGLSVEEAARVMGVSIPTVVRGWHVARLWLQRELEP